MKHQSFDWSDVRVRGYGEIAVAIGTQTQQSTFQGKDASGQFRVTQIARRRGDDWRFVGMHLCRVTAPPGRG